MEGMDELVREFVVESYENLDQLDRDLVALEGVPGSRELLGRVFRTIHTIKGTSGFFRFGQLERVTHAGESLLAALRDGGRPMDGPTTDVLLLMVDTVRVLLGTIEASGRESDLPVEDLIARLHEAGEARGDSPRAAGGTAPTGTSSTGTSSTGTSPGTSALPGTSLTAAAPTRRLIARPRPVPPADPLPLDVAPLDPVPVRRVPAPPAPVARAVPEPRTPSVPEPGTAQVPARTAPVRERFAARRVSRPAPHLRDDRARPADAAPRAVAGTSVRIDVDVIDDLVRHVDELLHARDELSRLVEGTADDELARAARRLSAVASGLQQGVMKTRMQPLEHLWSKMPRVVRDLAAHCGREVRLDVAGGDTELDRTLLEAVRDPLTHLVRNAVDHGIEPPQARVAAGKTPDGELTLSAYCTAGQVVVEVADDGRGIDAAEVAAKAVERGLRTAEEVATMSPQEVLRLVLLPGFSTATAVTNVSGRGVGMDVVRAGVEAVGGTVEIESVVGRGTTVRLRLPLTRAILPAVLVQAAGETYAVPDVCLLEVVTVDGPAGGRVDGGTLELGGAVPAHRLRGSVLPLVELREVLGRPARRDDRTVVPVAVLRSGTQRFGLVVDGVLDTQPLVVEPLPPDVAAVGAFAAAGPLGDGRLSLVLDVPAMAARLAGTAVEDDRPLPPKPAPGHRPVADALPGARLDAGRSA